MKEEVTTPPPAKQTTSFAQPIMDMGAEEDQRRKAAERINKLRNISFNMNTNHDVTGEFDNVPAYVRRNMELFGNTLTSVENYYSKYTVKKEENSNQGQISTLNKFLDEKKPD
jgi:cell division protein FtsZ